jgi:hypothetical protein
MRRFSRRALVALGLALSFVVAAAAPALASYTGYTTVPPDYVRLRTAADTWVPNYVGFSSGWDTSQGSTNAFAWMEFKFIWWTPAQGGSGVDNMNDVLHPQQAIEFHAEVDCAWADNLLMNEFAPGELDGYQAVGWHTNIPAAALPYEDTIFGETCEQDQHTGFAGNTLHSGRGKFGIGALNTSALVPGTMYYARFAISRDVSTPPPLIDSTAKITASANIGFDSQDDAFGGIYQLATDCNFSDSQIAHWNDQTQDALATRLRASWCSWADFGYYVGDTVTGNVSGPGPAGDNWNPNVFDQWWSSNAKSMEGGTGIMPTHWSDGSGLSAKTCNDTLQPAFDGSCYIHIPGVTSGYAQAKSDSTAFTSPWSNGYPSTSAPAGTRPSAEVAVRCRSTGGSADTCPFTLAVGFDPTGSVSEIESHSYSVPNNGYWYICRLDKDHYAYPTTANHSNVQLQINNFSSKALDVDYAFLGNDAYRKTVQAAGPDGQKHPGDLPDVATPPDCVKQYPVT